MTLYGPDGQPMDDPMRDALRDVGAKASMMITLYIDGSLTVDTEVNDDVWPEGAPVLELLRMLDEAGRFLYEQTDEDEEEVENDGHE